MENQPPFNTNASAWLSRKPATPDGEESELARLKERLSFYESFDSLIQENVSRASELLRHAATMRENAEEELAKARREIEEARLGDRQEYRALLSGLLDEVTTMQVQIERLARKVTDALDELESSLPAGGPIGRLGAGTTNGAAVGDQAAEAAPALSLDPAPEEIGPPEPEGEAEFRGLVPPEAEPAEAEAVLAEAAETPLLAEAPLPEESESAATADESAEGQEMAAAAATTEAEVAEPVASIGEVILDEVVQAPSDTAAPEPAEQAAPVTQAEAGDDGVISDAATSEPAEAVAPPAPSADEPGMEPATAEATPETPSTEAAAAETPKPASSRLPWLGAEGRPFSGEGLGARRPGTGELRTPEPSQRPEQPSSSPSPAGAGVATAVLVHGVPRATTALSLKRFLEGLPHVGAVEPREYAEGILRLHVTGERSLQIEDLRGWSDGTGLEPVHVREDLIEVRLPT